MTTPVIASLPVSPTTTKSVVLRSVRDADAALKVWAIHRSAMRIAGKQATPEHITVMWRAVNRLLDARLALSKTS